MSIAENFRHISHKLPHGVKLIAISKTKSPEEIMELYNCGHRLFGENKVQELLTKSDKLPHDIDWHMVGHMQSNKVKFIAPFIGMIHSIDSINLLKVISKEGQKNDRVIPCLLQIHIALEDTKFGMTYEEVCELLDNEEYRKMSHVRICGLMGMATFTENMVQVRGEFSQLAKYFDMIRKSYFLHDTSFSEISMGMSDDYETAIEEGSTMVRIGSALFGSRN